MVFLRKRFLKGKTLKEQHIRARTLRSLELLRAERKRAKTKSGALGVLLEHSKAMHGIKGKPFLEMQKADAVSFLDKKLLPSKALRFKIRSMLTLRKSVGEHVSVKKEKLVNKLFGGGSFGLLMIKPELFEISSIVRNFLNANGFKVVFNKSFVFSKEEIARIYPHTLGNRKKFGTFDAQIFSLLSAPSKVVVFSQQPAKNYLDLAKKYGIKAKMDSGASPQNAFVAVFKNYLRNRITKPKLKGTGFEQGKLSSTARAIDVLGFFEKSAEQKTNPLLTINGIHVPTEAEMKRDARTLLTLSELEILEKRLEKVKK